MKYADIWPGPVIDLTHLAEEPLCDPRTEDEFAADQVLVLRLKSELMLNPLSTLPTSSDL